MSFVAFRRREFMLCRCVPSPGQCDRRIRGGGPRSPSSRRSPGARAKRDLVTTWMSSAAPLLAMLGGALSARRMPLNRQHNQGSGCCLLATARATVPGRTELRAAVLGSGRCRAYGGVNYCNPNPTFPVCSAFRRRVAHPGRIHLQMGPTLHMGPALHMTMVDANVNGFR